ncbi:MAG: hypothetical protein IKN91_05540 [Paludibacteraceae bacterium]|nr:hypothetical protein [Paludibacteraceae bacterium]
MQNLFEKKRTYLHKLGHVLGLDHEHSRPDRDSYVIVNYNVIPLGSP